MKGYPHRVVITQKTTGEEKSFNESFEIDLLQPPQSFKGIGNGPVFLGRACANPRRIETAFKMDMAVDAGWLQ